VKVAILGPYPQNPEHFGGGVEAATVRLVEGLSRLGSLELHVITCQRAVKREGTRQAAGVTLHYLPRGRMGHVTFHARERRRMARVLRQISPDLVHAQGTGMYAGVALGSGYPAVITLHGIIFREAALAHGLWRRFQWTMASAYEKRNVKQARHVISISPYVTDVFSQWLNATVYPVENPTDDRFFELPYQSESGTVLLPARVIPRKNVLWFMQAWANVARSRPEARLRVAGELHSSPDYVRSVRRYLEENRLLGSVELLGSLSQEEMLTEYARCALVVLPSVQETAPVAVGEALSAGRPVVATRACGLPHMIAEGETGHLVDPNDAGGMAQAVIELLADEARRQGMGAKAREDARRRFKIGVVAERTRDAYRQVIETAGR
jgi:glycosyltransferase involved in cell wall biosynthesis